MALPLRCACSTLPYSLQHGVSVRTLSTSCISRNAPQPTQERRRPKEITDATPPKERHGAFYREIIPPLSKVLGYSALSFTVLYGAWYGLNTQADAYQAEEKS